MRWSVPESGEVAAEVAAAPDQVWEVLSDPTRTGEWSHECHTVAWLDGYDRPAVGAKFRGRNRNGQVRWSRTCTITELEPEHLLVFRTSGGYPPDSTEWRFRLTPAADGGTRITQSYRIIAMPKYLELMIVFFMRAHLDRRAALADDLIRLGDVAGRVPAVS